MRSVAAHAPPLAPRRKTNSRAITVHLRRGRGAAGGNASPKGREARRPVISRRGGRGHPRGYCLADNVVAQRSGGGSGRAASRRGARPGRVPRRPRAETKRFHKSF